MNALRLASALGILGLLGTMLPPRAAALPVFARKYGFDCTMCHSAYPRLNDYGERYRRNGYRLMGREDEEKTVLESPPPFAARVSGGYTSQTFENTPDVTEVSELRLNGVDILSAGLLAPHIGYFAVLLPEIKGSRGVEEQPGTVESANVMFSNLGSPWLNVRVGRMEPASTAFSVKRKLSVSSYEVYAFGAPGSMTLEDTQDGVELTGYGRNLAYAVGYLNGGESNNSDDTPQDVYARASVVLGGGEGQTAGQRFGVIAYSGRARPAETSAEAVAPADTTGAADAMSTDRESLTRIGIDASLNWNMFNLALQYLLGEDDQALWGAEDDVEFTGGFAEVSVMPYTRLVGFGRFDWVDTPSEIDQDVTRWTGGVRYYFVSNLALHLEYSHRDQNQPDAEDATEDLIAARLDLAF